MKKAYTVYNFPVSFLPLIFDSQIVKEYYGVPDFDNARSIADVMRNEVVNFALFYATQNDYPSISDIENTAKLFGVTLGNAQRSLNSGATYYTSWRNRRTPLTYISGNSLWHTVNNCLSDDEEITLRALLALRSIGRTGGVENKTTLDMIFARMNGETKPSGNDLPAHLAEWRTRRKWQKIKNMLKEVYNVNFVEGAHRGVIFTLNGDSS